MADWNAWATHFAQGDDDEDNEDDQGGFIRVTNI